MANNNQVQACRTALSSLKDGCENSRLALSRMIQTQNDDHTSLNQFLYQVSKMPAPKVYAEAFLRYKELQRNRPVCTLFTGSLSTPLAIGLGNESPMEIGLTTHSIYGMPTLPGSAIKGLCRRAALEFMREKENKDAFIPELFGNTDKISAFTFWDAWYHPVSSDDTPFQRDVITVHHPDYYSKRGEGVWPADFDDPIPVPFLSVRPGTWFLFAIDAPSSDWAVFLKNMLQWALENLGIGAKTNAGYGYFTNNWVDTPAPPYDEIWKGCQLTQKNEKGRIIRHLIYNQKDITIIQGSKNDRDLSGWLSTEQKETLKKKQISVDAVVRIEGEKIEIIKFLKENER